MVEERMVWIDERERVPGKQWIRDKYLPGHREWMAELEKSGKVFMHGHLMDESGGIIVFDVDSMEEAEEISSSDPIVSHGSTKSNFKQWKLRLVKAKLGSE